MVADCLLPSTTVLSDDQSKQLRHRQEPHLLLLLFLATLDLGHRDPNLLHRFDPK